jgi:hypothetical protein
MSETHTAAREHVSTVRERLRPLAQGWSPAQAGAIWVFAGMLARLLGSGLHTPDAGRDVFSFSLDLSHLLLKGMDDVRCLIVGGKGTVTGPELQSLIRMRTVPGRVSLIFVVSENMLNITLAAADGRRAVVFAPETTRELLEAADPIVPLKEYIVRTLPRRSLIPYDILHYASGLMFFGRTHEVTRLLEEDTTCFALAGPSRAGKTSVAKQYQRLLRERGGSKGETTVFIDLMECDQKNFYGYMSLICPRIGLKKHPESSGDFIQMLTKLVADLGQPLNLILDETDDLCLDDDISTLLATAAREGLLRLVLCGRGDLFRTMIAADSHFAERLELLRIGPLERRPSRRLLVEPLAALGLQFAHRDLVNEILDLTGQFPHLVQLYAKGLAEHAVDSGHELITREHLDAVNNDHVITQYFLSPLQDLRDPVAKLVALAALRDSRDLWTWKDIVQLVDGLAIDRAIDLCNELVINNVFMWKSGSFCLANQAMRVFGRRLGYLDVAFEEAKHAYATRSR